ncbi:hypothetical protein [Stenotrophomonas sp. YIM B06876]|uniref:hypothetical protein n=1 Tax=Stenotrophomonas sp. YIM B06876 TaxID=3060211 RepID=UPI00273878F4|nr:hypothetical protein [Stenotrophomonas sp. YIM B06876]
MKHLILATACALALVACSNPEAERQAQEAAATRARAAREQQAEALGKQYDSAVTTGDWDKARILGAGLFDQFPDSDTARRVEPGYADVKAKGEAARELRRMQALWNYSQVAVKGGTQRSATIYSKQPVDVDGRGAKPVQLVFRDHPEWKRHAYLVLQAGDFAKACYRSCQVTVAVDGGTPRPMAAYRPDTDEAIAMFITDHKAMWKTVRNARSVEISFPVKAGGTRSVLFETGGLDGSQMPAWD